MSSYMYVYDMLTKCRINHPKIVCSFKFTNTHTQSYTNIRSPPPKSSAASAADECWCCWWCWFAGSGTVQPHRHIDTHTTIELFWQHAIHSNHPSTRVKLINQAIQQTVVVIEIFCVQHRFTIHRHFFCARREHTKRRNKKKKGIKEQNRKRR